MPTPKEIRVDCYGHPTAESVSLQQDGSRFYFTFDDTRNDNESFHFGLFLDYFATLNRRYLRYPRSKRLAVLCEPGASQPFVDRPQLARRFAAVLTHDHRLLERRAPYVEFPHATSWVSRVADRPNPFKKTKLVSFMGARHENATGGHGFRNEVVDELLGNGIVDSFGRGIRAVPSKLTALKEYAFSIAMENCRRDYYFTEKIIDCLLTDTVPIYYGCPGITRYFDERGLFIFETLDQLREILASLTMERYEAMLPHVLANRQKAVDHDWHTRPAMFRRIAQLTTNHMHLSGAITIRPSLVRTIENAKHWLNRSSAVATQNEPPSLSNKHASSESKH